MFLPDVDFGFAGCQTKVFVKKNGSAGPLKEVKLPPSSKLSDLFEKASKVLDLECPDRAYYSNGAECTDIDQVGDDEVLHISCGEPFKLVEGVVEKSMVVGNYMIAEKLGEGGFGAVMKGVHTETGEAVAVKFIPKKSFRQLSDLQRVFTEIQALRNLRHPNIIRILDVADNPESICFIMEYAGGGELRGYVEKHKFLSEDESREFFKQIVRAVHYIHSKKIIHRDLKLENILLDGTNRCKIVDFGLSDYVSGKERTVTDAGTEAYLAPEVYNGYSGNSDPFKIDSWALGVILYAMTHGKLPFDRPDHETCAMLDKGGLTFNEDLTRTCTKLTKVMLTPSPENRASVDAINLDEWVTMHRFAMADLGPDSEDSGDAEPSKPSSMTRRDSRSNTLPGRMVETSAAESPRVGRPAHASGRPRVGSEHLLDPKPRGAGGGAAESPHASPRTQRHRRDRPTDGSLPSLPAGRGRAGGAPVSHGRRPDVSPVPRRAAQK